MEFKENELIVTFQGTSFSLTREYAKNDRSTQKWLAHIYLLENRNLRQNNNFLIDCITLHLKSLSLKCQTKS